MRRLFRSLGDDATERRGEDFGGRHSPARRSRRTFRTFAVVFVIGAGLIIHHQHPDMFSLPKATPSPSPSVDNSVDNSAPPGSAAGLRVAPAGPITGYSRAQFGPAWADVDHNGCDTRDDILARDLSLVQRHGACEVVTGRLLDPYTGRIIAFRRGIRTSGAVQIDHVVALGNAWQTGAASWSAAKRERFANDPRNLLAVDGPSNEAKGDRSAAVWLPANPEGRCIYVLTQIRVKRAYGLWTTPAEYAALAHWQRSCTAGGR